MKKNCKSGFTLVELSIVLVIIGLLIGGILVGQSLIGSAKIQTYVRKLQQYEIANKQFVSKFKSMAGDSPYLTPAGNNNKILETSASLGCSGIYLNYEIYQVWFHLKQSGMSEPSLIGYQTTGCGAGATSTTFQFLPVFSEYGGVKNYILYTKGDGVASFYDDISESDTRLYKFFLSTIEYLALDEKMDGQASSKIYAASEDNNNWASSAPSSLNDEIVIITYSPDRQLSDEERLSLYCGYFGGCD